MNSIMNAGIYKKIGKNGRRTISLLLCAAVMVSLTGCGQTEPMVINEENEAEVLEQVLTGQVSASHSSGAGKEETVYVMTDAGGKVNQIIVSDWVKNADGSNVLEDISDLNDIQNVKGYEEFTAGSDGTLTWNANGADIYYQGTTDKALPVEVKISYTLDGREISPQELAGKSGKVTIRFDYENKQMEMVEINGKKEEVYIPFAMISGMALPGDTFSNIEVTNAKLISEGNNNLIVGVAFPGLKESLKMEELKEKIEDEERREELEIPDYIEVSADATNFSLNMTMTMAMSDVLSDIALTDSIDLSDMNTSMEDLQDASKELIDGTEQLKDGTGELRDGAMELRNGTGELKSGSGELKNGASDLKNGTAQLAGGTGELKAGADTLKAGTRELYDKSGELSAGARKLDAGTVQLMEGSKQLAAGTQQLAAGSLQLDAGAEQIQAGLTSVDAAITAMVSACEGNGQMTGLVDGAQSLAEGMAGLDTLLNQYFALYEKDINDQIVTLQNIKSSVQSQEAEAQARLAEAQALQAEAANELSAACEPVMETVQVEVTVEGKSAQVATVSGAIAECSEEEIVTMADVAVESVSAERVMQAADAYRMATEQVAVYQAQADAAHAQADAVTQVITELTQKYMASGFGGDSAQKAAYIAYIKQASNNLKQGAQSIHTGVSSMYAGLKQLNDKEQGVPALAAGAATLKQGTGVAVAGTKELSTGAAALDIGIGTVKAGADELAAGTVKLAEGTDTLNAGAGALQAGIVTVDAGARTLDEGAGKLKEGAVKLDEGAAKLDEGAVKLDEGAVKLDDGAVELKDGMIRFDEEGISKLTELFGDDVQEVLDRIDAVKMAGSNYNTFTKLLEGTDGSVRFIYKTDAVKAK